MTQQKGTQVGSFLPQDKMSVLPVTPSESSCSSREKPIRSYTDNKRSREGFLFPTQQETPFTQRLGYCHDMCLVLKLLFVPVAWRLSCPTERYQVAQCEEIPPFSSHLLTTEVPERTSGNPSGTRKQSGRLKYHCGCPES